MQQLENVVTMPPQLEPDLDWMLRELRDTLLIEVAHTAQSDLDAARIRARDLWREGVLNEADLGRMHDIIAAVAEKPREPGDD